MQTSRLHLVLKLSTDGVVPLLPLYALVARTEHKYMGHVVEQLAEVLRSKLEGRGFVFQWCNWNFSLT